MRAHLLDRRADAALDLLELGRARRPLGRDVAHRRGEHRRRLRRVADDPDVGAEPLGMRRVDVDRDDLQAVGLVRPAEPLELEPRPDPEHDVRLRPELEALGAGEPEVVLVADDPAAAPERDDRRLEQLRQLEDLRAGLDRAAADHDHRPLRRAEEGGRALDRRAVRHRRRLGRHGRDELHVALAVEDLPRHLERNRPRPPAGRLPERLGDEPGRVLRRRRSAPPTSSACGA